MNEKAMYKISYGLFILTTTESGHDCGCVINTAMQVTSQPNQISIAVNKMNHTHDMILKSGKFNVSTLSEEADFDIFKHFGFQCGRDVDKFAGYADFKRAENGIPYITKGANSFISAEVVQTVDLGTHTLFIGKVTDMDVLNSVPSATYDYYHAHIKPKPEKVAAPAGKTLWRCGICGYIYEGEELPADFICPICKHDASVFVKVVNE